jgi:lipopolysaccharide biosynthesis glycosyltransferase
MNIAYSSSEYYFEPTFVSIYSLLSNSEAKHCIVLLSTHIAESRVKSLDEMVQSFGSSFKCYDISKRLEAMAEKFCLPEMRGGYSTYARVFLADILVDFNDVLLIDSDTLILGDVSSMNISNKTSVMLACRDYVISNKHSMHEDENLSRLIYYNMGVLYINLEQWRKKRLTEILENKFEYDYKLLIADQSIINKYLNEYIEELEINFNFYTYFQYNFDYDYYQSMNNQTKFLSYEEFSSAVNSPTILHFIGVWYERPWFKKNICPYKEIYISYWEKCFHLSKLFDTPKRNIRNILYDSISRATFTIFGLKGYFLFRYKFIQLFKKILKPNRILKNIKYL